MDKKYTTIGVLLLIAALASIYFTRPIPRPATPASTQTPSNPTVAANNPAADSAAVASAPATSGTTTLASTPAVADNGVYLLPVKDPANASYVTLENEYIVARFTDFGGALQDVALKKYPAQLKSPTPFVFNAVHVSPMLALVDVPAVDAHAKFQLVSHTATEVVYRAVAEGRLEVTRRFTLVAQPDEKHDPYVLRSETTFRNLSGQSLVLPRVGLSLGTAARVNELNYNYEIATGYSNGKDQTFIARSKLEGGNGFFGVGASEPKPTIQTSGSFAWTSLGNEFFVSILTPDQAATGMTTRRVKTTASLPDTDHNAFGLTNVTEFEVKALPANGTAKLNADFYVGPKEYRRLSNSEVFKIDQDKVMQFGFFKFFSQLLVTLMTWLHGLIPNWGIAIILTTLTLKTVFLPLTLKASKSMKRMAKLQPEMKAIREKFKDSPQKQQMALMELYKTHKINPMGGCIPMLLPLPFFFGFYTMLRSTAELRFEPFLWAHDLSAPDTVAMIFGLPLNIFPLLMGATMIIQMQLTPQPGVDNAQMKMMKFMPILFILFYYNFSCALSLYSFANGLFTIGQQLIINRMKDDPISATPSVEAAKVIKNVTPKKKK